MKNGTFLPQISISNLMTPKTMITKRNLEKHQHFPQPPQIYLPRELAANPGAKKAHRF